MKNITLLLFCLLSLNLFSQISISENFNASTSLPSGWTASRYSGTATQACNGNSFRSSLYSGTTTTTGWLSSPNYTSISNGQNTVVTFDYKIVNFPSATTATAAGWGNLQVQMSQDNGVTWLTQYTLNDSNHTISNVCTNKSFTIPASSTPIGSDFKLRFLSTWAAGDYYFYIDNVNASQSAAVPSCNAVMTTPTNLATNVEETTNLNWSAASGFPTGYILRVGTTPSGTQIVNNINVGNVTFYDLPILSYSTTYYVTITPTNGNGNATGCSQYSFTTKAAPPIGNVCENPIIIPSLPYSTSDNTSNYADDYSGGQGINCGSNTQFYLDGDDVVYRYTATTTGFINVNLIPSTGSDIYSGIFIYGSCADIGTNCLAGVANGTSNIRTISQFPIITGQSYFIVISSFPSPQSIAYTLNIQLAICTNPTATYTIVPDCSSGNTQFFINTNVTSLGSATSVTVSDNLGSIPVSISSIGNVQLGPYQNSISALIFVTNNQNSTCVLTSPFITQNNCPPSNDNCNGAIDLVTGSTFVQNEITSANFGALPSIVPNPGCTGSVFLDVWYKVVVPTSGNITVETRQEPGGLTDTGIALYTGNCSGLTLLQCDNDSSSDPLHAKISLTGRTPGEILYIRVWDFGGNDFSLFRISAYDCSLGVASPTGNASQSFCNGATISNLVATGTSLKWYSSATGGIQLSGTQALVNGTSYFASQTISNCESASRLQVIATVTTVPTPTGNANQTIPVSNVNDATLANLVVNPANVIWYATLLDAQNNTNPLLISTVISDGNTYYAVNNVSGCSSTPFGISVSVVLSNQSFSKDNFKLYPIPVKDILVLKNDKIIKNIKIIDLSGKEVLNKIINLYEYNLDLAKLESGTYLILLAINDEIKSIKFVKK